MTSQLPTVVIVEEGMREGMQIESADIPVTSKIRLLDALSETGLKNIVVGSFVSPKWVPQMAQIDQLLEKFTPNPHVTYTALALNARGVERRNQYIPPLAPPDRIGRSMLHLCDVFVRRNTARSAAEEQVSLPATVAAAVSDGATTATVAVNAAWGSNWLGKFTEHQRTDLLQLQIDAWAAAGIRTTGIYLGDPMSWNTPRAVVSQIRRIRELWPQVSTLHLHLHNGRGGALASAYAALHELNAEHTLVIDSSIGGMGGCPYCGNGRATKMIPTEDLVDLLEGEGVPTGIDLEKLIEAAHLAEEVVGHELYGHVSKVGRRPEIGELYPMNMPLVETIDSAQHFRLGPQVYAGNLAPWREPIASAERDAIDARRFTTTASDGAS